MRWCVYEAGKTHARGSAPDYRYYASVKDRIDGKRAAISEARKIIRQAVHILAELGDGALAAGLSPAVTAPWHAVPGTAGAPIITRWGSPRPAPARRLSAATALPRRARGRPAKNERPHPPAGGGTPNQSSCRRAASINAPARGPR